MFFIKDAYARVWHVDVIEDRYAKVRISTSDKDKDGNYVYSNWFAMFVGKAKEKVESLERGDRITIITGKVANVSVKQPDDSYKTYLNVTIFDFEKSVENFIGADLRGSDQGGIDSPPVVQESEEIPF